MSLNCVSGALLLCKITVFCHLSLNVRFVTSFDVINHNYVHLNLYLLIGYWLAGCRPIVDRPPRDFHIRKAVCIMGLTPVGEVLNPLSTVFVWHEERRQGLWLCYRLHDRRMCALGFCTLMNLPSDRPQAVNEIAPGILPSLVLVFKGLKKAYEGNDTLWLITL